MTNPVDTNKDVNLSECWDKSKQPLNDINLDGVDANFKLQQHKAKPTHDSANND